MAFEDERVEYPEQLARWVSETRPGTTVKLVWVRDEVRREGTASLGEATDSLPSWALPASRPAAAPIAGGAAAGADTARR